MTSHERDVNPCLIAMKRAYEFLEEAGLHGAIRLDFVASKTTIMAELRDALKWAAEQEKNTEPGNLW